MLSLRFGVSEFLATSRAKEETQSRLRTGQFGGHGLLEELINLWRVLALPAEGIGRYLHPCKLQGFAICLLVAYGRFFFASSDSRGHS